MQNEVIKKMLQDGYNSVAYTDKYILVYNFKGTVYFTICDRHIVDRVTCLDRASRGAGYALRFKPNTGDKLMLMTENATPLCSAKFFDELVDGTCYNRGEIAEKLVTEYTGQEWVKDNVPFTMAGDIIWNGIAYQIKYEKATFTNEKALKNLMK
ncbi:MAG: hypothetical protein IJU14_05605 [Clostridia bacterium]|nr:hypothetical protein [Clostridia bacterium]